MVIGSQADKDAAFMQLALREAAKGVGLTSPNPPVGCVITKGGQVLGKGWHSKAGCAHAEREAIADVRRKRGARSARLLRGATLYVTLEPCSSTGKTAACTDAVIEAGICRVVFATVDPNPAHAGRAAGLLRSSGIEVTSGILEEQARHILRPFAKHITTGMPWVIAKAAISLDGRITLPRGESQWLTGDKARDDAQKIRARSDAIVIGAGTLRADNPRLTLRGAGIRKDKEQPWRVVLTRSGELPSKAHLFTDEHKDRTLVFRQRSLATVLKDLGKRGVLTAMIEGGGNVLAQAFRHHLVDEVCFYMAPVISGSGKPVIDPDYFRGGSQAIREFHIKRIGKDLRVSGIVSSIC